jgi:hypothetical protein
MDFVELIDSNGESVIVRIGAIDWVKNIDLLGGAVAVIWTADESFSLSDLAECEKLKAAIAAGSTTHQAIASLKSQIASLESTITHAIASAVEATL